MPALASRWRSGNGGGGVADGTGPGSDLPAQGPQGLCRGGEIPAITERRPPGAHRQFTPVGRPARKLHVGREPHPSPHKPAPQDQQWPGAERNHHGPDEPIHMEVCGPSVHQPPTTPRPRDSRADHVAPFQGPPRLGRRQVHYPKRVRRRFVRFPPIRGRPSVHLSAAPIPVTVVPCPSRSAKG
jgi:hypothetical protein